MQVANIFCSTAGRRSTNFRKTQHLVMPNFPIFDGYSVSKIDNPLAIVEIFGARVMKP